MKVGLGSRAVGDLPAIMSAYMVVSLLRAANNTLEPLELKRLMEQAGEVGTPKRLASPAYGDGQARTSVPRPWHLEKND